MDYGAYFGDNEPLCQLVLSSWEPDTGDTTMARIERDAPGYKPQCEHFHETLRSRLLHYQQQQGFVRDVMSLDFGSLSHMSLDTKMVHSRHNKGEDHDMILYDENGNMDLKYESCKFDIRMNPLRTRTGNWDPKDPPPTSFNPTDKFLAKMAQFPYCTGLKTAAPFTLKRRARFAMPTVNQTCPLTRIWNVPELRMHILQAGKLYSSFPALANLGRTCQAFYRDIGREMMCLDTTSRRFHNLDKSPIELYDLVLQGVLPEECIDGIRVPPFLAVMPVRHRLIVGPDHVRNRYDENGWYDSTGLDYPQVTPIQQLTSMGKIFKTVAYNGEYIQHLQLHRVSFLDMKSVQAIVSGTTGLKSLGIYNCELMHVGITEALLKLIGETNEVRTGNKPIDLDFSPRYHLGPMGSRTGSYGATWSDPHEIPNSNKTTVVYDLSLGLAVIGLRAARLGRRFGIDLLDHHKAFRNWWERIPFGYGQSTQIAHSIMNLLDFEKNGGAQAAETYNEPGEVNALFQLYAAMKHTVHLDLLISATGKPENSRVLDQRVYMTCKECGEELLPGFFDDTVKQRRPEYHVCIGCQFQAYVGNERDHQKQERCQLMNELWANATSIEAGWILSDEGKKKWAHAQAMARYLNQGMPVKWRAELQDKENLIVKLGQQQRSARGKIERDTLAAKLEEAERAVRSIRVTYMNEQETPVTGRETIRNWDYLRKWYFYRQRMECGLENNAGPYFMHLHVTDKAFNM